MSSSDDYPTKFTGQTHWVALCSALALASILVWTSGLSGALIWQSGPWQARPWSLWSAALAHLSGMHLVGNLLALAVLAVLGAYLQADRAASLAVLIAWPLGTMALAWWPQITWYSGLSGLLCAMLAVLWVHAALSRANRAVSWALLVVLALKLGSEHAWTQPIGYDPNWGFNVVYAAHLAGALAGAMACSAIKLADGRRR
ncbi:MAG: rhombosortase [Rhodoferax sp.]|nr:rhombosortase [Rhodoferax sp.]